MFWNLLFAHFVADYPLQSNWMVRNKKHLAVIGLHAGVHLLTSLLVVWPLTGQVWPAVVAMALAHWLVDAGKTYLGKLRPQWVIWPYLLDQALHYLVLWLGVRLLAPNVSDDALWLAPPAAIWLLVLVFVTHVWFITERILVYRNPMYVQEVLANSTWRMLARAALLGVFSLPLLIPNLTMMAAPAVALLGPYRSIYGRRAMLIDVAVPAAGAAFIYMLV